MNALFKVKLLALVGHLADLLNGTFPTHFFPVNFSSNCCSGFLIVAGSKILYSKASLSNTRKESQSPCALQTGFSGKIENVQGKCQCRCPASVMLPLDFIKPGLHHGYFSTNVPTFFGIFIWLVTRQIIIALIGLCKGNCRSVIEEIL